MTRQASLLLTRPEAASRRFAADCKAAWGEDVPVILSPVMQIQPIDVMLEDRPAALILTSENGANCAGRLGLTGLPAWCVGPRTTAAARVAGLRPIEAGPDAEGLLAAILARHPSGPLLHLRGEHARGRVAERLRLAGLDAQDIVAYQQVARPPTPEAQTALAGTEPLIAPIFSPRSALLLAAWNLRAPLHIVAISEGVADAADRLHPETLVVASAPESHAMVEATVALLAELRGRAA